MKRNNVENKLIFILIIALFISSYLIYIHYSENSTFCDISPSLSCDIVNKSRYAEFPPGNGIPVSILGFIAFFLMLIITILIKENYSFKLNKININKKLYVNNLIILLIISLIFALYLVYAEIFLILSVCILCVALDVLLILMLYYSFKLRSLNEK